MKLSHVVPFVLAISAASCGKPSDLAPMRSETTGLVDHYKARIALLEKRLTRLARSPVQDRNSAALLADSAQTLQQMKLAVTDSPQRIETAAKAGTIELSRLANTLRVQLRNADTIVSVKLDALDDIDARAAFAPRPQVTAPAPAAPEPPPAPTPQAP